jgi:hypothetical protein
MDDPTVNSKIYIGQPLSRPFPITLDQFQQALTDRYPNTPVTQVALPRDAQGVNFTPVIDGDYRTGALYSNGYLILEDGDGATWAEFIAWFLTLIPGHAVEMMAEVNSPTSAPIPADATPADIAGIYDALVAPVA